MTGPKLGMLKNGAPVFDRPNSHLHDEYNNLLMLLPEVLQQVEAQDSNNFDYSHDFGYEIGKSICVPTNEESDIIYAKRPNRSGLTRFTKDTDPIGTSILTVVLKRDRKIATEQYLVVTAYIGAKAPPEPWDRCATDSSIKFWNTHALVWGSLPVIPGTETERCPW